MNKFYLKIKWKRKKITFLINFPFVVFQRFWKYEWKLVCDEFLTLSSWQHTRFKFDQPIFIFIRIKIGLFLIFGKVCAKIPNWKARKAQRKNQKYDFDTWKYARSINISQSSVSSLFVSFICVRTFKVWSTLNGKPSNQTTSTADRSVSTRCQMQSQKSSSFYGI